VRVRTILPAALAVAALVLSLAAHPAAAEEQNDAAAAQGQLVVTGRLVSEVPGVVRVAGAQPGAGVQLSGPTGAVAGTADASGAVDLPLTAWREMTVVVVSGDQAVETTIPVDPAYPDIRSAPEPTGVIADPPALGPGANPAVLPISPERQASMTGVSWRVGCLPFTLLREIQVNYIAPDGFRHRGVIISRANAAERVALAFTQLHDLQYRIWSMHPVDVYGPSPIGTGANDYASMASGNTSMFNCRYIVGRERERVQSPHAGGRALDLNPWENPYRSRRGPYPNGLFLPGPSRPISPMVLTPNSPAVLLLKSLGWQWLGPRGDYQHFDLGRNPA
jgi:hypothetical protein